MLNKYNDIGQEIVKRFDSMKSTRVQFEPVYKQIDKYFLNENSLFMGTSAQGTIDNDDLLDTTGVSACEVATSILHSGLTNTQKVWFDLAPKNVKLKNIDRVKRWIAEVVNTMINVFNSSESNFAQQNQLCIRSMQSYGTCCMYIDMDEAGHIHFSTRHLSEIYIMENAKGIVDTVFREFEYTARNAVAEYGIENVGEKIAQVYQSDPDKKFKFIHACVPLKDARNIYKDNEPLADIFSYVAYTVACEGKKMVKRDGFTDLPYKVGRYDKNPAEIYGRSAAWKCLPDVKMLNAISRIELQSLELGSAPIWGTPDDGIFSDNVMDLYPNAVIPGAIDSEGRQVIKPLFTGINPGITDAKVMRLQDSVRRAFVVHEYFGKDGTPVSAAEIYKKVQDSQIISAPHQARVRTEYLNPIVNRVFGLLLNNGMLPPPPQELIDEKGQLEYEIEYVSPFVRQQRFDELSALNRAVEANMTLIQANPDLLDVIDAEGSFRNALDISGVPLQFIRKFDDTQELSLEQYREQKGQAQQQAMAQQAQADAMSKGISPGQGA